MTTYMRFTECNEWEGETWRFYIPTKGNEEPLQELKAAIDAVNDDSPYSLDTNPIPESAVDNLIQYGNYDDGYMAAHNKLSGTLILTPELLAGLNNPDHDLLYKGGIRDFVTDQG